MPPPADARLVPGATTVSVHGDNVMESHSTSGTFMQNREVKGRRRLNCCVTYCLWITSKQNNSPPERIHTIPKKICSGSAHAACAHVVGVYMQRIMKPRSEKA